jgi:hypothetical protein
MPWIWVRRCSIGRGEIVEDLHDCGLCKDWTRMEFSMSCLGEFDGATQNIFRTLNFSRHGVSLASALSYFGH